MADYERSQTVEAPAGALFEFLADVGNLPRYFEQMTAAEPAGGEAVRVTAVVDGREREVEDRPEEINQGWTARSATSSGWSRSRAPPTPDPDPACRGGGAAGSLRGRDVRRRHGGGGASGRGGQWAGVRSGHRCAGWAGALVGRGRPGLDGGWAAQRGVPAGAGHPGCPCGGWAAASAGRQRPLPGAVRPRP